MAIKKTCKCLVDGSYKLHPCSSSCHLFGDCVTAFCKENVKPMTNADHIRSMSDEELAHLLTFNVPDCINYCADARCGCKWNCKHGEGLLVIKEWLKQPYKEKEE